MAYTPKNPNGQGDQLDSAPVVVASDQPPILVQAGDQGQLPQVPGTLEQFTYDTLLEKLFGGTSPIVDSLKRLSVLVNGSVGLVQQRPGTGEQTTYDSGMNPVLALLLSLVQSLVLAQTAAAPAGPRMRVQQDMADLLVRLQEQAVITALQAEWDTLENQDYQMNLAQSVNGGALGYALAQGLSGMSCYLIQEVR